MLEANSICVEIDDIPIINKLSFTLDASQLLHIKGKNGAGKTTLLRAILGLQPITQGSIHFSDNDDFIHSSMGYISHNAEIEPLFSLEENIEAALLGEYLSLELMPALKLLGLDIHKDKLGDQLSQGQRKKLSLARFLMVKKSLWLLDEPFAALDLEYQAYLNQWIGDYVKQGGSIILTSHLPLFIDGIECRELVL